MSEYHEQYKSPMEDVYSWNTPAEKGVIKPKVDSSGTGMHLSTNKRRCEDDDSGYATTPHHSLSKSRLLGVSDVTPSRSAPSHIEAFGDLLIEPSLYNEPMDVSCDEPTSCPSLCPCNEKVVDLNRSSGSFLSALSRETPRSSRSSPAKRLNFFTLSPLSPVKKPAGRRRYMDGFEHLDILYFLGVKMNLPHVVDKILSHLDGNDLSSVRLVSKSWKDVTNSAAQAKNVWLQHVGHVMINKENIGSCRWSSDKQGTPLVDFNHSTPFQERQPRTPPSSPSKFSQFRRAALDLRPNQNLMHCPRCRGPSACTPEQQLGECVSPLCRYTFCSVCKQIPHAGSCSNLFPSSPPNTPPKLMPAVCSKRSRRNLRRL